ncbi:hypothetical protein [Pseudoroseomonas cervicalis]|uniref:hypothetical protein n=1 Tax=Teichococcus cervicalis TaxID=204525 RepID=UPI0022F1A958|nr:hypothetical protein [Pseudoroseomonas cervicalis]WBV44076.1 hypothetical protein PFY06_05795 [Pseudoroseomonas cervicalis]
MKPGPRPAPPATARLRGPAPALGLHRLRPRWSPPPRPANDRGLPPPFRPVRGARRAALGFLLILLLLLAAGLRF